MSDLISGSSNTNICDYPCITEHNVSKVLTVDDSAINTIGYRTTVSFFSDNGNRIGHIDDTDDNNNSTVIIIMTVMIMMMMMYINVYIYTYITTAIVVSNMHAVYVIFWTIQYMYIMIVW